VGLLLFTGLSLWIKCIVKSGTALIDTIIVFSGDHQEEELLGLARMSKDETQDTRNFVKSELANTRR
jgi:hypothetical protein